MRDCAEYQEWISALLDGRLGEDERRELRAHIAGCAECAALYEAFSAVSGAMELEEVPAGLHERVMGAVHATIPKKKIPWLMPTLSAAACFVAIVSCVLILRPAFGGAGSADTASAGADSAAPEMALYSTTTAEKAAENGAAPERGGTADAAGASADWSGTAAAAPEAAKEAETPMEYASEEGSNARDAGASDAPSATAWPEPYGEQDSYALLETELEVTAVEENYFTGTVVSDLYGLLDEGDTLTVVADEIPAGLRTGGSVIVRYYELGPIDGYPGTAVTPWELEIGES